MELNEAKNQAKQQIAKYCPDYSFKFDNANARFGLCNYGKKTITLSKKLVLMNDEARVNNTILHEIAHVLAGGKNGHNHIWKAKAIEIGCDGKRCYNSKAVNKPEGRFVYECPECKKEIYRHRRMKSRSACSQCCNEHNGGKFTEEFVLRWVR